MPKLIDLTGQKFNSLTVIKRVENIGKKTAWLCKCDCGKEIIVKGEYLRNGTTKSCGCKNKKDLTNQRFGRLIAIKPTVKRTKDRCVIWYCKCDCGKTIEVSSKSLIQGNTKSCGCLSNETRAQNGRNNKIDLTGKKFGFLTVIKDSGERKGSNVLWLCQCKCGNKVKIKGTSLLHGVKSCGCLKSKGEQKIIEILNAHNIDYTTQKTFDTCCFDNKYPAYFDFYIENKYLIEYDGEQHFNYKNEGWNNKENFNKTKERDLIKNQWCKQNNIPLIRIPYWKLDTLNFDDLNLETSQYIIH